MIIRVTARTYAMVGGGDVAAVTSFAVAASLSIFVYVALPVLTVLEIFKRHKHNART